MEPYTDADHSSCGSDEPGAMVCGIAYHGYLSSIFRLYAAIRTIKNTLKV